MNKQTKYANEFEYLLACYDKGLEEGNIEEKHKADYWNPLIKIGDRYFWAKKPKLKSFSGSTGECVLSGFWEISCDNCRFKEVHDLLNDRDRVQYSYKEVYPCIWCDYKSEWEEKDG